MILINHEKLQQVLKDFYNITKTRIAVLDHDYREISAYPSEICTFCKVARKNPIIEQNCLDCDHRAFSYVKKEKKQYTYLCHLGLYESVYPIFVEKNIVGFLMIGQFIEETEHEKIKIEYQKKYGNMDNISCYLDEVAAFNKSHVSSIASIMSVCAEYLCFTKTISQKNVGLCARIDQYIESNLHTPLSVESIANAFNISKTSVYLTLKQGVGMSVTEYVNYKKIERAKKLMRQGISTNAILEQLAFSDANYFSRVFRKITGTTIREYKKGSF